MVFGAKTKYPQSCPQFAGVPWCRHGSRHIIYIYGRLCQVSVSLIRFDHHSFRSFTMLNLLALVLSLAAAAVAAPTSLEARAGRTSPPSGCLSVGSSGTYKTVSAAVAKLSTTSTTAQCIFIYKGPQYLS